MKLFGRFSSLENQLQSMSKPKLAIIGAGFSGIFLAQELQEFFEVKIFEKSRGSGGRMSTRYAGNFTFDHGAQYFNAESKDFKKFIDPFIASEDVSCWKGNVISFKNNGADSSRRSEESYFVGSPKMNSLCKKLAGNLDISLNSEVAPISPKKSDGWHLKDKNGNHLGVYDFIISTAPIAQTKNLFSTQITNDWEVEIASMLPSFVTMIGFNHRLSLDWIAGEVEHGPIKLISFNSSKPGRDKNTSCFVIISKESWAKDHLEEEISTVEKILVKNFEDLTGILCDKADYISTHRWRYALSKNSKKIEPFFDKALRLGATGDWVLGSRIEDVWLAAKKLSDLLKTQI